VKPKDHLLQDQKLQEKTGASLLSAYAAAAAARDKGRSLMTGRSLSTLLQWLWDFGGCAQLTQQGTLSQQYIVSTLHCCS
jgi:hypothetical protein